MSCIEGLLDRLCDCEYRNQMALCRFILAPAFPTSAGRSICMSLAGCRDSKTMRGNFRVSLARAARKCRKNVTAPMHRIASAILMTSPDRASLYSQTHWTTPDVRAGTRIHKEFVRAARAIPDFVRLPVRTEHFNNPTPPRPALRNISGLSQAGLESSPTQEAPNGLRPP